MLNPQPPACKTYFIDLPLTRLHIMETGQGEPLIMMPATISELQEWRSLAQFMAQWFHVYFFELPGHGLSEPFRDGFSSQKVAELVGQLADKLGHGQQRVVVVFAGACCCFIASCDCCCCSFWRCICCSCWSCSCWCCSCWLCSCWRCSCWRCGCCLCSCCFSCCCSCHCSLLLQLLLRLLLQLLLELLPL